jgi:hypothetical protein
MKKNDHKEEVVMKIERGQTIVRFAVLTLAMAALTVALVGCSGNLPLAPQNPEPQGLSALAYVDTRAEKADSILNDRLDNAETLVSVLGSDSDSALVGSSGGRVVLNAAGEVSELIIPPKALERDVWITAREQWFDTPLGRVRVYDFGPEGLVFRPAATLHLKTNLPLNSVLKLFYFNPVVGEWQLQQALRVDNNGVVSFKLHHFSKYAIT